jgi:hypothetical protein
MAWSISYLFTAGRRAACQTALLLAGGGPVHVRGISLLKVRRGAVQIAAGHDLWGGFVCELSASR